VGADPAAVAARPRGAFNHSGWQRLCDIIAFATSQMPVHTGRHIIIIIIVKIMCGFHLEMR
jgi:hypothetical protein